MDHEALDETRLGVKNALQDAGFVNHKTILIKWESAQGNPSLASQIAQKFVGQRFDVIVSIGTMASQAAIQATQGSNIPIIYASVTDPKAAKLEGNLSGVSNYVESDLQFKTFKRIMPKLKSLGVIYNPGEANSVALLEPMKKAAKEAGIELVYAPASKTSDVHAAAVSIVGKVDALFVNNDNTALSAFDAVVKAAREAKKPAFVSDDGLVEKGAIAAIGPDQHMIGIHAGRMVASLVKNPNLKAADIPQEKATQPLLHINLAVAKELGIVVDDVLLREAIRIVD